MPITATIYPEAARAGTLRDRHSPLPAHRPTCSALKWYHLLPSLVNARTLHARAAVSVHRRECLCSAHGILCRGEGADADAHRPSIQRPHVHMQLLAGPPQTRRHTDPRAPAWPMQMPMPMPMLMRANEPMARSDGLGGSLKRRVSKQRSISRARRQRWPRRTQRESYSARPWGSLTVRSA